MPSHLSAAEQKQVQTVIDRARGDRTVPHSAQESIPFQRMFPDGICRVTDNYYTKTIQFQDINYQLAQQEDQTAIFEEWCSFLNFFDSSIRFELSFMNMATDASNFEKMVRIPYQKDHFNPVRTEYSTMLRRQLAQGNNGLTKTKYLTFGIEAESMKQAKPRLIHIEIDLMNNFKRLGVRAKLLNGKERLHLMHDMFHMGDHDRFNFDWKWLPESGLSVKDFIAPTGFAFPKNRIFQMGGMYGSMSYLQITASDLSDQLLKDFLDMESSQIVTMHIQSVDQNKAIKSIKHTITELDRSKIEEQKKAIRSGYDMDIIPSDLATYGKDAKALVEAECAGQKFGTKGKTVTDMGWRRYAGKSSEDAEKNAEAGDLPKLSEGMTLELAGVDLKEGKTSPPKRFTEDLLLSAMESASSDEFPAGVERKGIGTPATRAAIIEKLVQKGFIERRGDKRTKYLCSTDKGNALVTVVPEQIQSPSMTADWEEKLLKIEHGEYDSDAFMGEISSMVSGLVKTYEAVKGADVLMQSERKVIGSCPACGSDVCETGKGWFCRDKSCKFALWKENRFFQTLGKQMTEELAKQLVNQGKARLTHCYSKKSGRYYDTTVRVETGEDGAAAFKLEFGGKE